MKRLSPSASKSVQSNDLTCDQLSTGSSVASSSSAPSNSRHVVAKHKEGGGSLYREPICPSWTRITETYHGWIRQFVVALSVHAARHPWAYIIGISLLSLGTVATGLFTNFEIQVEYDKIYAPHNSRPTQHMDWLNDEAGFPEGVRHFTIFIHNQGDNVMGVKGVQQMFQALKVLQDTPGYDEICAQSKYAVEYADGTKDEDVCNIFGVTRFYRHNETLFQEQGKTDQSVMQQVSNNTYPDGVPVFHDYIMGHFQKEDKAEMFSPAMDQVIINVTWHDEPIITYAESLIETIFMPKVDGAEEFEKMAMDNLLKLQEEWREEAAIEDGDVKQRAYQIEMFSVLSYSAEFQRAIFNDFYLIALVAIIMIGFTCLVFYRRDRVQSRSLLGMLSVYTITMSVFTGHGLMFICGIPFTNMTMMLPFVVFGVGLDDTFIITGAFFRTNPDKQIVHRIKETMEEIGSSISLTTITTTLAFGLGYLSTIPAIQWLCLYAFVSVAIDFVYQITLFVAFMVIDERRVAANRRDICFCVTVKDQDVEAPDISDQEQALPQSDEGVSPEGHDQRPDAALRFMSWYADFLLRPTSKLVVLAGFAAYFGFCVYRTTLLTQEFIVSDFLPKDSYVGSFLNANEEYADDMVPLGIYFRNVNQSDPEVQQEMISFIDDLVSMEQLDSYPPFCWVRDFNNEEYKEALKDDLGGFDIDSLSFNEQLDFALTDPRIRQVYGDDIVRDEKGNILSSRCTIYIRNINLKDVHSQIEMLNDQRAITEEQPLNKDQSAWSFFTFVDMYFLWEFYAVCVQELTFTTIFGVFAVTAVAFLLMPHWTATPFVLPIICILYIDLLGTIQFAGLHINAVTYVCLNISIGLLVDFLMHILLRYYESEERTREDKVKDTLKTMGVSIMIGGLSTFLAVIPLAFSTSTIIGTVFTAFFAMVTLGVAHGLIFLPVVLSIVGPTMTPKLLSADKTAADTDTDDKSESSGGEEEEPEPKETAPTPPVIDQCMSISAKEEDHLPQALSEDTIVTEIEV